MRARTLGGIFCFVLALPLLQAEDASIVRISVDEPSGLARLVSGTGKSTIIPAAKDQVRCEQPRIAEDQSTAGWLIDYENCCTSYPIPLTLVIYRAGRILQRIRPGLMIFDWRFVERGKKVALSSGTVHGMTYRSLSLYESRTGRLLSSWDGGYSDTPPAWARGLSQ